ncbi:MAG: helix-turn-helix transcriptional regulator, partial [Nitrososphaerales archaeon]
MVKQPDDTFAREEKDPASYVDNSINGSGAKQESVVVEDTDVRPNDEKVLETLGEDRSRYTFKGLVRKLGIHQESLSRSLRRLDELGLVEKSDLGYKLSRKGELISRNRISPAKIAYTPLMQTYIPSSIDVSSIVSSLAGRWFKSLRWLGMIEGEMGHSLQWVSEDNTFQVNLRIVGNYIIIETNAGSDKDKVEAMVSAYKIFEYVSKLYSNQYGNVSMFHVGHD